MARLGLERDIVDDAVYRRTISRFREMGVRLPTFAELAEPARIPASVRAALSSVDPDMPHALNLFRVHWWNDAARTGMAELPGYVVLPPSLTGVPARIVVALGQRFPMIAAHKVLAAYACLAPRLITGQFDPSTHKAVWPSTGNYCRGGVAISRILGCRGVAVLPAGMSEERFRWLDAWVADPADIVRTPGTESNVKEIYDECARLDAQPDNVIFNQFSEFGNHLAHWACTGRALGAIFESLRANDPAGPELRLAAFVSATGSAGTLAAGDHLKDLYGSATVAVEATECPTMLENGFGEHNIQGIGDKHIPFIHNVMATDFVVGISDAATDCLALLFNTPVGRTFLRERKGIAPEVIESLSVLGLSGICNVLAAIKVARHQRLGSSDVVITVATDDMAMYGSENDKALVKHFAATGFDALAAAETWGRHLAGQSTDHVLELGRAERNRIFNLGYFTWVEQQGVSLPDFEARRTQSFWRGLRELLPVWDRMIEEFNEHTGALA